MNEIQDNTYVVNLETGKLQLHFDKNTYLNLDQNLKNEIKRFFSFSRYANTWVSKASKNLYYPTQIAQRLGLENGGKIGEHISFEEKVQRKQEKAQRRAERYQSYLMNSKKKQENYQREFRECAKDWSWLTQPNINTSAGRAFTNQREKIVSRFEKGFEEMEKQAYYSDVIANAQRTAEGPKFNDIAYLSRQIEDRKKSIRRCEEYLSKLGDLMLSRQFNGEKLTDDKTNEITKRGIEINEQISIIKDELSFFEKKLNENGGVLHTKESLTARKVTHISYRRRTYPVKSFNKKTATIQNWLGTSKATWNVAYAEIKEVYTADDQIIILDRNNEPVHPIIKFK